MSATWMSHPVNALYHKLTDRCIVEREDKQRQVTVLWPVLNVERYRFLPRHIGDVHSCSDFVSTRLGGVEG